MTTGKTTALTRRTFVGKIMSLLFNMLPRLIIAFLPRSKCLLISWLQSPSAVILEPRKIKSVTVSTVPHLFAMKWYEQIPWSQFSECWVLSQLFTLLFHFIKRLFSSSSLSAIRVVLEKALESPLDCREIQSVHPKGNQSWIFIGRTDVEAETPILWLPDAKNQLIWKDPDARKDWRQKEKGTTEDEMVGWHHQLNGHECEKTPGVGDGQWGLACCSPWSCKGSDMSEWLNWTEYYVSGTNWGNKTPFLPSCEPFTLSWGRATSGCQLQSEWVWNGLEK